LREALRGKHTPRNWPANWRGFARAEILERQVPDDARSSGVSAYTTRQGVRWRVAVPQPDGSVTTRRGYRTHEAACQARERLTQLAAPGAQASFARFWRTWLAEKRP